MIDVTIGFWKRSLLGCLAAALLLAFGAAQEASAMLQLTLSWYDSASNETGFSIERTKTTDGSVTLLFAPANLDDGQTVYHDTDVAAGNEYCYRVRAFNNAGVSAYSNVECGIAG